MIEDKYFLSEIFDDLKTIDDLYKEFCKEIDKNEELDPGTTYNSTDDYGMEFYIDDYHWKKISNKLKLKKLMR